MTVGDVGLVGCVHEAAARLGESGFWDTRSQSLFWVDITSRRIHNHDPATGRNAVWQAPEDVGCVATHGDGGLVVALRKGFYRFSLETGAFAPIFIAGEEPAISVRGLVWRWDFEPGSGAISNRRVFVEVPVSTGVPDGATVDADGFVWIAHWGGWRVVRYDPNGRIDRVVMLPVSQPSCPAFGGRDLMTLYVTSAAIGAAQPAKEPLAGGLFAMDVGVKGIAEVAYDAAAA